MSTTVRTPIAAALVLACVSLLAACSGSAPQTPTTPAPSAMSPVTTVPAGVGDPTLVPGGGSGGSGTSGSGGSGDGSVPGDPGAGAVTSPPNPGGGQVPDPQPTLVNPVAGLQGVHAVGAVKVEPGVNGSNVSVRISWWSGVEPCSVLAGVTVTRDGNTFALTVTEGSKGQDMACIEIAIYKATIVDLGKLDRGTYTISAKGDAPAVQVEIKG